MYEQSQPEFKEYYISPNSANNKIKFIVLGVFIILLILVLIGVYLVYLGPFAEKAPEDKPPGSAKSTALENYINDESTEEKKVRNIQGIVEAIDYEKKTVTLVRNTERRILEYKDGFIYIVDPLSGIMLQGITFSDIKEGDVLSYNPADPSVGRVKASWLVSREKNNDE